MRISMFQHSFDNQVQAELGWSALLSKWGDDGYGVLLVSLHTESSLGTGGQQGGGVECEAPHGEIRHLAWVPLYGH